MVNNPLLPGCQLPRLGQNHRRKLPAMGRFFRARPADPATNGPLVA
jgi:hypothetical protein